MERKESRSVTETLHILFIGAFIALLITKLSNILTLSWFWVFFFLWAPFATDIILCALMLIIYLLLRKGE